MSWMRFSLEKWHFVKIIVFCMVFDGFSWSGGTEIKTKIEKICLGRGLRSQNSLLGTLFGDLRWIGGVLGGPWVV